jgi:phenylacetate-coenzyme A ligase PaaK-like adenylate-forming protein
LTREIRERVEAAWGIAPANLYASTEAPIIAASSPAHPDALELGEDTLIAEVVDERNRPVAPGEVGSKLLITSLLSRTLPLIRYELSDRVTLATGPNPAGRPYRTIASIDGRAADTLRLPASSGGEIELLPHYLTAPIARTAGVQQYQILWDGQRLELCVVLGATASPDTTTRLGAELTRALGAAGVLNPAIHVRTVAELQREPGPAAKLKLIKSTVGER